MQNYLALISQRLSPGLRKIFNNFSWLLGERLLSMVISLVINIYVIRYLGPTTFGQFSYAISYVGLFEAIAKLGLDSIVIRNIIVNEVLTNEILGTAFVLKLYATIVTIFLVATSIIFTTQEHKLQILVWITSLSLLFSVFDVIDFWFQAKVLSGYMAVVRSIQLIISSLCKITFIHFKFSIIAFAWLLSIDGLMKMLGMLYVYKNQKQNWFNWKTNKHQMKSLLKDSWPLILSSFMVTIYMRIDQVMLGNMTSIEAVGDYAAAIRFSEVWYFIPVIISSTVFPAILRAKQRSETEYLQRLQQLYDFMVWLSLIIGIFVTLTADFFVDKLLGHEYQKSAEILIWHIWALPFVFLGMARGKYLMAENFTQLSFATTSMGMITNIVLNIFLIPIYGGVGAAIATTISYSIAGYSSSLLYPALHHSFWMLTKALFIPFRIQQNIQYFRQFRAILSKR